MIRSTYFTILISMGLAFAQNMENTIKQENATCQFYRLVGSFFFTRSLHYFQPRDLTSFCYEQGDQGVNYVCV